MTTLTRIRASRVGRLIQRLGVWYIAWIAAWFVVALAVTMVRMWPS